MRQGRGPRGGRAAHCGWPRHVPVLLSEVVRTLAPTDGKTYLDGTFGAGGYSRAILAAANCRVIAIDRDPDAISAGASLADEFAPRLTLVSGTFSNLDEVARRCGVVPDGIVLDLGVSSMQLDEAERGFSFQADGPLDMRMAREGPSAADIVNELDETALASIIFQLGEESRSRAIARAIVRRRSERPLTRTSDLARTVAAVLGARKASGRHPATRTFQALRLYVNDELGELARGLAAAERVLTPGGRLAAVTFHSLEDRIVKRFFAERSGTSARGSRHLPDAAPAPAEPSFRIVNTRPLTPGKEEQDVNPRSRSARLRAGERTRAAPLPLDPERLGVRVV